MFLLATTLTTVPHLLILSVTAITLPGTTTSVMPTCSASASSHITVTPPALCSLYPAIGPPVGCWTDASVTIVSVCVARPAPSRIVSHASWYS